MQDDCPLIDEATGQYRLVHGNLAATETVWLTVQSGSMLPLMPVGARIEVAPVEGPRCRVGDVVVFPDGGRLVAHRLVFGWGHAPGGWFLQRGDGFSPTGIVRPGSILGRVVAVRRSAADEVSLTGADQRWRARREARRSLVRFVHSLLASPVRKVRRWRTRGTSDSV